MYQIEIKKSNKSYYYTVDDLSLLELDLKDLFIKFVTIKGEELRFRTNQVEQIYKLKNDKKRKQQ